jgi:sterol O-acyltransferase
LKGKSTKVNGRYPKSLTLRNHYEFIVLPTLVYELEYPRSDKINWWYVLEKAIATLGTLFIMMLVSQTFIYPVVIKTIAMKETGMPLQERFDEFPWILSDLLFPFMMEYLASSDLIFHIIIIS